MSSLADGFDGSAVRVGPNHSTIEIWYDTAAQAHAARRAILSLIDASEEGHPMTDTYELPTSELRQQVEQLRVQLAQMEDRLRRREDAEWRAWQLERSEALGQKISAAIRQIAPS